MEFVVPELKTVLTMEGIPENPMRGVTVNGISFLGTPMTLMDPHGVPSRGDWALQRIGTIFLEETENISEN